MANAVDHEDGWRETELAPGIYLVQRRRPPPHAGAAGGGGADVATALHVRQHAHGDLCGSVEWLEAELQRTLVSVDHLQRSNDEMARAAAPGGEFADDPDLLLAVQENVGVIQRQQDRVRRLRAALAEKQTEKLGEVGAAMLDVGHPAPPVTLLTAADTTRVVVTTRPIAAAAPTPTPPAAAAAEGSTDGSSTDAEGVYL